MTYQLKVISLDGCPYSQNTEKLLKEFKIPNNLIRINAMEKEKYKNNLIRTFPQIYLEKNGQSILLGGNSDLEEIIDIKKEKDLNKMIQKLGNKYRDLSKKTILRILELFI